MFDVARWLAGQGLGHHAEAFAKSGVAGDVLRDLTDADLKELGLNLGDRKRLLKAIAAVDAGRLQRRGETAEPTAGIPAPREAERRQLDAGHVPGPDGVIAHPLRSTTDFDSV